MATSHCHITSSERWLECFYHAVLGYAVPAVCNGLEHAQRSWIATLAGGGLVRSTRRRVPAAVRQPGSIDRHGGVGARNREPHGSKPAARLSPSARLVEAPRAATAGDLPAATAGPAGSAQLV